MTINTCLFKILLIAGGFFLSTVSEAQTLIAFNFDEHYTITERQDIRQRLNGAYKGFVFREWRGVFEASVFNAHGAEYEGTFYNYRRMTRNMISLAKVIDETISATFSIDQYGEIRTDAASSVPPLRNIPVLPRDEIAVGDVWQAYGMRIIDPRGLHPTRVKVLCEYTYTGITTSGGGARHHIRGQYALRYRGDDPYGDPDLKQSHGKHVLDIYIPVDGDSQIFMRDLMEDQYYYRDGKVIQESGVILTWFDAVQGMDRESITEKARSIAAEDGFGDIQIKESPEGLIFEFQNIQFHPDEARMLPGQEGKIQTIIRILKLAENRMILVTGHTADIGSVESQQTLSEARAKVITELLEANGIPSQQLIYQGKGGTEPIAPNDIEANMAKNRRVEITILEGQR